MTTDDQVFVRAHCATCGSDDVWLQCNACSHRHHFTRHADHVACDCGAKYATAKCTCGADVPIGNLEAVPFDKGPVRPEDFEVAWGRVAALSVGVVGLAGGLGWWFFS
ncbi:MAG: hypothetical protein ACI8PZ_007121 [Myxococcota bacterium]|jgi:hypothetical protein